MTKQTHSELPWKADEHQKLVDALRKLSCESAAVLGLRKELMREVIGNTNYQCLQTRIDEARALLLEIEK